MRKPEYKPLLFTTTVREPLRIKQFLSLFLKFDGQILTDALAEKIVGELIKYGVYRPMKTSSSIAQKWETTPKGSVAEEILSDNEVHWMLENNPQKHKEAGFARGWPSRFATFFDFCKELGFVYFAPNEAIKFSEAGKLLANIIQYKINDTAIHFEEVNSEREQQIFLNAFVKSQRSNPFVRVKNDNVPLLLLLKVIKYLNEDKAFNNTGISILELPLLIFWKDNDAYSLYKRIKKLRTEFGYNPSPEVIVDICINEIMAGEFKKFTPKSIISEYPDEYIRKMRLTGIISLRGGGRFIDINKNEQDKVDYILKTYSKYEKFSDEVSYFNYISQIDERLINDSVYSLDTTEAGKYLEKWAAFFSWDTIKNELIGLSKSRHNSQNSILRLLTPPVRLEFLSAVAIKSKFPNIKVVPNYPCDDEGIPTSTAPGIGDKGDIECLESIDNGVLVEVTMMQGRNQTVSEIWPISRHLKTLKNTVPKSECIFIAPTIFSDSQLQIDFVKHRENNLIRPYKIEDFVDFLETVQKLSTL